MLLKFKELAAALFVSIVPSLYLTRPLAYIEHIEMLSAREASIDAVGTDIALYWPWRARTLPTLF